MADFLSCINGAISLGYVSTRIILFVFYIYKRVHTAFYIEQLTFSERALLPHQWNCVFSFVPSINSIKIYQFQWLPSVRFTIKHENNKFNLFVTYKWSLRVCMEHEIQSDGKFQHNSKYLAFLFYWKSIMLVLLIAKE